KELIKMGKELEKVKVEFGDIEEITKGLKAVNEFTEKFKKPEKVGSTEIKNNVKKLEKINDLIEKSLEVEDFADDLKDVNKQLRRINKLTDKLRKFYKLTDASTEFTEDLERINE